MPRLIAPALALVVLLAPAPAVATGGAGLAASVDGWFDALERGASGTDGLIAYAQLQRHSTHLDVATRLDDAAGRLLDRRATDPLLAARLREWQGTRAARRGDLDAARAAFAAAGYLPDWATLGPFPSYGGEAMGQAVGPEGTAWRDGQLVDGLPMRWVERPGFGAQGYVDLSSCHEERRDVVAFARVFVRVDEQTPVALYVGGGDGLIVDVAGRRVLDDPARRDPRADQRAIGAVLPAGWSAIRVKAGQERGPWGFYLRLTTPDGRPLRGVETSLLPPDDPLATLAADAPLPTTHDPIGAAIEAATRDGADAVTLARAAQLLHHVGPDDRRTVHTAEVARAAIAAGAADPWLQLLLAEASDEPEEQRAAIDAACAAAPELGPAWLALHNYLQRNADRRADLEALRAARGDPASLDAARAWIQQLREWDAAEAALAVLDEAADHHPGAVTLGVLRAQLWLDLGNEARALAAYDAVLAEAELATVRSRRATLRRTRGDHDGAIEDATVLAGRFPHALRYQLGLARELAAAGRDADAGAQLEAVRDRFPDAARLYRQLGDRRHALGDTDGAVEAWEGSLARRPRDPELERYLRFVSGGDDTLRDRWRRDVEALPLHRGSPALFDDAPARVLLDNRALVLDADGVEREYRQRVVHIDTAVGARAFEAMTIRYDRERERLRVLTAEVLRADGSRVRARRIHEDAGVSREAGAYYPVYVMQVEFDELRPGDRIHVEYRRDSRELRNRFGDFFGALVPLQEGVPTVEATVHVVVPDDVPLFHGGRGLPEPTVEVREGEQILGWTLLDQPAVPAESNAPGYFSIGTHLSVSNLERWDDVAAWWLELSREQFRLGGEGDRVARELATAAPDVEAAVRAIHRHVVTHTHYIGLEFGIHGWKPYEAREVLERGYGDCKDQATLLVAMLGAAEIEAELVLVQTTGLGSTGEHPANLHAFNHAIVYVPALERYLDPTAPQAPFEALRWDDQGALALRIGLDGRSELVHIPVAPAEDNRTVSDTRVTLDRRGDATFAEHWTERGVGVTDVRALLPDPGTRLEVLERNYQDRLTGVRLTDVQAEGFDDLGNALVLDVRGEVPGLARVEGDTLRVPVTLFPDRLGPLLVPEGADGRRTDLVLRLPHVIELSTTLIVPPGMRIDVVPEGVALENPHARFTQSVTAEGDRVVVRSTLTYLHRVVPQADYAAFRRFCLAVDRAQGMEIVLAPAEGGR